MPKTKTVDTDKTKTALKKASPPRKRTTKPRADEVQASLKVQKSSVELDPSAAPISSVGRRKTAVARVRLIQNGQGQIVINSKPIENYFTTHDLYQQVLSPLKAVGQETTLDVSVRVAGGGVRGQAEAVRNGVARALIKLDPVFRKSLKKLGFLTRDARKRERKKFGLKSARRAPQWSKR